MSDEIPKELPETFDQDLREHYAKLVGLGDGFAQIAYEDWNHYRGLFGALGDTRRCPSQVRSGILGGIFFFLGSKRGEVMERIFRDDRLPRCVCNGGDLKKEGLFAFAEAQQAYRNAVREDAEAANVNTDSN